MGSAPDAKPDTEIIGVMENISYRSVREQWEQAYFPIGTEFPGSNFYVRFRETPRVSLSIDSCDPLQRRSSIANHLFPHADEQIDRSLNTERMLSALSSSFGTLALLLSLVGLYGVFRRDPAHARDRY